MTELHIVEYDEVANQIETIKESANFLPNVSTDEGYEKSKRVSLDVGKLLTALEKTRKAKKSYFLEGGKQVDSQAKAIVAELELIQLPHKDAYKELDNLKKEREASRKADLEARVCHIRTLPEMLAESSSDEIQGAMEAMQNEECLDFCEYSSDALKARNATREALAAMFIKKDKEEKDAIELAKLKREQAEREQKEREDKIAKDAAEAAEKEKEQAIARENEAKEAAEKAKKQAEEAEAKRVESEKQAKIDAENARIKAAKDAEIAKEQAEKLAKEAAEKAKHAEISRQTEEKRLEAAELAKREADKKHIGAIRGEAKDCLIGMGIDEEKAKEIVLAISKGDIKNVSIQY
jgi:hypothetical protein